MPLARLPRVFVSTFKSIRDDFALLDEWEDRYRYVIELGHGLEPLSEEAHNNVNKVRGCVSQVWLEREERTDPDGRTILHYRGDSNSHLVRGLIAIAIALYSDQPPQQILRHRRLGCFPRAWPRAALDAATIKRRARDGRSHSRRRRGCCRRDLSRTRSGGPAGPVGLEVARDRGQVRLGNLLEAAHDRGHRAAEHVA